MNHTYDLSGMHCQSCVKKITAALQQVPGVRSAIVTLSPQQARVEMTEHISTDRLSEAVKVAGDYTLRDSVSHVSTPPPGTVSGVDESTPPESLYPLFLIVGYILGVVLIVAFATHVWSAHSLMNHFMAGFFLVFSFFKLLDLRGFADAYRSYDVVARKLPAWGVAYPFVELGLGVLYLVNLAPWTTNIITLVVMLVSSIGVLKTLIDKRSIRCACLGTVLKLPMTKVTLVEDLGMAAMAAAMLVLLATGLH